jgi:hydrogenase-4 component F
MLPFLLLALCATFSLAVLTLLVSRFLPGSPLLLHSMGGIGPLVAAIAGLLTAITCFNQGAMTTFLGIISVDAWSALLLTVIALVSGLAVLYSVPYMGRELRHGKMTYQKLGWYYFWLNLLVATMYLSVMLTSLGLTWVLIEATTLASVPLVGSTGTPQALEAAWKYLIIASVGISLALFGVLLTYIASVHTLGEQAASLDIPFLFSHAAQLDPGLIKLAFLFILVGYGTKTGLAPMHTWLPDAHSQAPTPISALLSGALLPCALSGIVRFTLLTNAVLSTQFTSTLLQIFGLLSIGIVIPFLIRQEDFKRLLAYSSVEHMGIIVLAIGIGGELGRIAAALHLFNHAIAKSFLFCTAGEVTERYQTREMRKIRGVLQSSPLLGTLLLVGVLAITGLPPFNIFLSELLILGAAFAMHQYLTAGLLLLLLTAVFASLIAHPVHMAFGRRTAVGSIHETANEPNEAFLLAEKEGNKSRAADRISGWAERTALCLLVPPALILLLLGVWLPSQMQEWLHMIGMVLK